MSDVERLEDKIDRIASHLGAIDVTLAAQHETLKEHIKRSENLEKIVMPMKDKFSQLDGIMHAVCLAGVFAAIIEGFVSFLTYLHK